MLTKFQIKKSKINRRLYKNFVDFYILARIQWVRLKLRRSPMPGLTTYTALKSALPVIYPGSTTVVIGIGGLGLDAVQFLRQLTGARIVAIAKREARLKLAQEYGADDVVTSGPDAADQIRELSGGIGAAFVLDCVGVNETLATGVSALSWRGRLAMVGAGGGSIPLISSKWLPEELVTSLNGGGVSIEGDCQSGSVGSDQEPLGSLSAQRGEAGVRRFQARTHSRSSRRHARSIGGARGVTPRAFL